MRKIIGNERGIALILVILILSVIVAVTIQLNLSSRAEVYEAANMRDGITLTYIAKSGFNGGRVLLKEDMNNFDSLTEDWAQAGAVSAASGSLFDDGYFSLAIEDETGKIQVNSLVPGSGFNPDVEAVLLRFLSLSEFGLTEEEARDIVDAIKDWIDEDDEVTGFGAEDLYYRGLNPPYRCKNGPMDCIDELLMVKGVTRELYYGEGEVPGICKFLSVHGNGKININTAPKVVFKALSVDITDEMASEMDAYRRDEANELSQPGWYRSVQGMADITIPNTIITSKGSVFSITSTGYLNTMTRTVTGIVEKNTENRTLKLLSWNVR
ncbi:MAG: general secretion pathway protein GspK [Deltaproteobacteria bacterium]|nr:general secretion pathway protein GspK [Deltaproteobacteria bacterium]